MVHVVEPDNLEKKARHDMMGLADIHAANAAAKRKTERGPAAKRLPCVFTRRELAQLVDGDVSPFKRIPNFGDYEPKGWEAIGKAHFVDASGFGEPGEPAMPIDEFAALVVGHNKLGHGYAIVEAGQFQIYIQEYRVSA